MNNIAWSKERCWDVPFVKQKMQTGRTRCVWVGRVLGF